eukprot:s420_g27.t1
MGVPRYLSDTRSTVLLGSLRMRQLRVQPNVGCSVTALVQHVYPDCYSTYDVSRQSQEPYDPRFAPTYLTKAYRWQPVEETQQVALTGSAGSYSGSGYFIDLPANKSHASGMLRDLHVWRWVDKLTRAVTIELTTMSTNVNVIVNTVLFFLLIDGYSIDIEWFRPGKERLCREGLWKNFVFRALIYFVLLNIFVAIVLDTFSLASRLYAVEANKQNPMIAARHPLASDFLVFGLISQSEVFLRTYWNWMKGQSLVKDESEEHMNPKARSAARSSF